MLVFRSSATARLSLVAISFFAFGLLFNNSGTASAQVRIPRAAFQSPSELQAVYDEGSVMERDGRWGEALSLYEKASRRFPQEARLKQELSEARLHFDVRRRYADSSFVRMAQSNGLRESLEIYQEVLLKIQTFHVDAPAWPVIVRRGAEAFLVSAQTPEFQQVFNVSIDERERRRVIDYLNQETLRKRLQDRFDAQRAVQDFAIMVEETYGIPSQAAVIEFACGATTALDWYSSFLTTDQYSEVMSQIDGNFVGLGVELKPRPECLEIISVIPSGPAGKAGLLAGEKVIAVDQRTVFQLGGDRAADMLRGPEGSLITLTVEAANGQQRAMRLVRARVEIPSVEQRRIVDATHGVAYIKLSSFQRTTRDEVQASLWELHRKGMESLIIDLRGNPGGLLDAAVEVADLFMTAGTIVTTKGRNLDENSVRRANFDGTWRVPVVVMIDQDSASASEILAGALRDSHRATVVGNRSYGKGSVQGIFSLNTCSAGIRLTTAKFYSPSGRAISNAGVEPDVAVTSEADDEFVNTSSQDQVVALRPNLDGDQSLEVAIRVAKKGLQRNSLRN